MNHELMRQAAKRSLATVTQAQRDLAALTAELEAEVPNFYRVTEMLVAAGETYGQGFKELNRVAACYEALVADWKKNGEPPQPPEPKGKFLA
ncbi:hypothetical protein [Rhodanobacter sp. OR87]|uniref:hypothetical protein n=1 Tax=Rhodanobacter sp. OR87 TaxID=1076523 RepID=UPI0004878E20|nr:hypothetical protein [Rhodanobacter sp. OR87]